MANADESLRANSVSVGTSIGVVCTDGDAGAGTAMPRSKESLRMEEGMGRGKGRRRGTLKILISLSVADERRGVGEEAQGGRPRYAERWVPAAECQSFMRCETYKRIYILYLSSGTASTKKLDISSMIETELAPFLTPLYTLFARNEIWTMHVR
jgi:hypothetical protein